MLYNPEEQKLALAQVMEAIPGDEEVVAIGEIGLDYFQANQAVNIFVAWERQRDVFFYMSRAAQLVSYLSHLPLVLHIRDVSFSRMKLLWIALTSSKWPVFQRSIPFICIVSTAVFR